MTPSQARMIIGEHMRELRSKSGASLRITARVSGWDKGHLSRVERGHTKPGPSLVRWYDQAFGAGGLLLQEFLDLNTAVRQHRYAQLYRPPPAVKDGEAG